MLRFHYQPYDITVAIIMLVTLAVLGVRLKNRIDLSWPLLYWVAVISFLKAFDGSYEPWGVYMGLAAALLLKFEFMGGVMVGLARIVEIGSLVYVVVRSFEQAFL